MRGAAYHTVFSGHAVLAQQRDDGRGLRLLQVEIDADLAGAEGEDLFERGHPFLLPRGAHPAADVQRLQFGQGEVTHGQFRAAGVGFHRGVVHADQRAVFRGADVDFDEVAAQLDGLAVGGQGVFRDALVCTAVRDDIHAALLGRVWQGRRSGGRGEKRWAQQQGDNLQTDAHFHFQFSLAMLFWTLGRPGRKRMAGPILLDMVSLAR
jgi:hypothetical protein